MVTPQLWCFQYLFIATELCRIFLFLPPTPTCIQILCWLEATSFIFKPSPAHLASLKLISSKPVCKMWRCMTTYAYLWKFLTLASINHSKHFITSKNDYCSSFLLLQFIHASCQTENIPSTCVWWQAPGQKCLVLFYVSMKLEKLWYVTLMLLFVCLTSQVKLKLLFDLCWHADPFFWKHFFSCDTCFVLFVNI